MNEESYLLLKLAEECNEVAERAIKAVLFGLDEIQPGQLLTNTERVRQEFVDLFAVWGMVCQKGVCQPITFGKKDGDAVDTKQEKVRKYMDFSESRGTLDGVINPNFPHPESQ